ncbi:MAG TPA: heavy-metal-associated domain-containing protein [Acidimicrobiales bacterium]|nr:heavy-metal-associated domain-containing protein [Acidimicrobiales bacterium]
MAETITYRVPGMSCEHCRAALSSALRAEAGVDGVEVDLEAKLVTVSGARLDDTALRAAIVAAGYKAE